MAACFRALLVGALGLLVVAPSVVTAQGFRAGRGIADMTGLVSEGATYGYADPNLDARGLQLRQYSRSFIFEADNKRVLIITPEIAVISQALHDSVMEGLSARFGALYTAENVVLTAQHSHSTPGGYNAYFMYMVPSGGWINQTAQANIDGILTSVQRAHDDLQDASVYFNTGELLDASVNRAPYSYDQNPQEERDSYQYNVDKNMNILKIVSGLGEDMGMFNLFPVHTTSMTNKNHIVSTDNKGVAAQLFEKRMNPTAFPGQGAFVAAFAQSAEGDVVPDVQGTFCNNTDVECSYNTSQCAENPDNPDLCHGRGPAGEQFADTQIIGERQYAKAAEIYDSATEELRPVVDYRFTWVNITAVVADLPGQPQELCPPAMGYSFAAGGTNGPGIEPFHQGMLEGIPELDELIDAVWAPPDSLRECHQPKPILIPTGILDAPGNSTWPWQPAIVAVQLIRIGDVVFVAFPSEITTMASRRVENAVKAELLAQGFPANTRVLTIGIANVFTSYVVTPEEYQVQRYEGASTSYGPYTLDGYIQEFVALATAMGTGAPVDIGTQPPDLRDLVEEALEPILPDGLEEGQNYGDVLVDALDSYQTGETAFATFVSGNPRNDIKTDDTFLAVERQEADDSWTTVYTDAHWETKFIWTSNCQERPPFCILPNITGCTPYNESEYRCRLQTLSNATIEWDIPSDEAPGTYRLIHYGNALAPVTGRVVAYQGVSRPFQVTQAAGSVTRVHSREYHRATEADGHSTDTDFRLLKLAQAWNFYWERFDGLFSD